MLVLRCTRKLLDRLGAAVADPSPSSTTLLGDWYANLVNVGRQRLVLCISEKTLLPVVLEARNLRALPERLAEAAGAVLRGVGIRERLVCAEQDRMREVAMAPTRSKKALGTLNILASDLEALLEHSQTLFDVSMELAKTPCLANHSFPDEATRQLFRPPGLIR